MSKRKLEKRIKKIEAEECRYNQIKTPTNILFNIILAVLSFICVIPFIFVIIISITDEQSLTMNGYRFVPEKLSLYAYEYIVSAGENIIRSYGVTILVTISGTIIGLLLTGTYAYALSRKSYAFRKFFTTVITIPMLFSGGMIANYLIVTKVMMLKDTIWALILPMAVPVYNIVIRLISLSCVHFSKRVFRTPLSSRQKSTGHRNGGYFSRLSSRWRCRALQQSACS